MKRWLVALLLVLFCFHALPVLELSKSACAWIADDAADADEEGSGEEPVPFAEKEEAVPKWCEPAHAHILLRLNHDDAASTAHYDAATRLPSMSREVVAPPPDAAV